MMSKALSWFAHIGQISSLLDLMGSPLIKPFAYNPRLTGSLAFATGYTCRIEKTHSFSRLHARRGPVTRRPAFVRPLQPKIWGHSENQALRSLAVCAGTLGPVLGHQDNLPGTALRTLAFRFPR